MFKKIEKIIVKAETYLSFHTLWVSIIVNPVYIIRKQIFEGIKEFSRDVSPKSVVLDVGCGTKPYKDFFSVKKYIGIDVRGGGLEDNIKKADKYFDGQNIPYLSKKFDIVIATEVLEHAPEPKKLLKEMYRVLKPGGKILLTMPFVWQEHGVPFDFQRYTSLQHQRLFRECGFKNITTKSTTGVFGTCGQLLSDYINSNLSAAVWNSKLKYITKFILARLYVVLICFPIQLIFELLDLVFNRTGITLDYLVTADK